MHIWKEFPHSEFSMKPHSFSLRNGFLICTYFEITEGLNSRKVERRGICIWHFILTNENKFDYKYSNWEAASLCLQPNVYWKWNKRSTNAVKPNHGQCEAVTTTLQLSLSPQRDPKRRFQISVSASRASGRHRGLSTEKQHQFPYFTFLFRRIIY